MAARLRSLHDWADAEAGPAQYSPGGAWYSPYTAYLGALSVVDGDFLRDPERDITRAELAHVLARTLPEDAAALVRLLRSGEYTVIGAE